MVLNKNSNNNNKKKKTTERKPTRRTKSAPCFRVGSGGTSCWASVQSHFLDCMVGLRSVGRNYICIYIYTIYVYIYICIHTDTPPTTTTTPHMLVTGTRVKKDNKTHSQSSKP